MSQSDKRTHRHCSLYTQARRQASGGCLLVTKTTTSLCLIMQQREALLFQQIDKTLLSQKGKKSYLEDPEPFDKMHACERNRRQPASRAQHIAGSKARNEALDSMLFGMSILPHMDSLCAGRSHWHFPRSLATIRPSLKRIGPRQC